MFETNNSTETAAAQNSERRHASRFPIERALRVRVLTKKADSQPVRGLTINMSSNGVFFTTEAELSPGRRVEARHQLAGAVE